mgnify:CR=1 FL=1
MFYLIGQIAAVLITATISGILLGWWGRSFRQPVVSLDSLPLTPDPFEARSRLEQCHRDNANLRRDLKDAEDQINKFQARLQGTSDTDLTARLHAAEERAAALLQDLQWRDDTIAALERELAIYRAQH